MNNTLPKEELALRALLCALYGADDTDVCEITDQFFAQPITCMENFESAMELLPTWVLGSLYHVWGDAPNHQYIKHAYEVVKDVYLDRIEGASPTVEELLTKAQELINQAQDIINNQ